MATTLFDLEGTVALNSEGFFTSAEAVNTKIEDLATAVGNLETKLSGVKISSILDSATFTAEQIVVTGGLDALAEKVEGIREKLTAFDLGGTLLSAVTGGVAALAGNLLIGDIKVGVDVPTTDDIDTAVAPAITHIESLAPEIGITLPDATVDPLASDILNAGTAIADALDAACAWSIPVPNFPDFVAVRNKIKAMWSIVTAGLNLSVDAFVNVNMSSSVGGTGGVPDTGWNTASTPGKEKLPANSFSFWNPDSEYAVYMTQEQLDRIDALRPDWGNAVEWMTGDPMEAIFGSPFDIGSKNGGDTSGIETAMFSALSRWAQPIGEDKFAGVIAPKVSNTIARGTRGSRG